MLLNRTAFEVFGWPIQWYGIVMTSGMVIGFLWLAHKLKKRNVDSEFSLELFIWAIVAAIVGARFLYVAVRPDEYFPISTMDDLRHVFAIWEGGLTVIGGVLFGFFAVLACCKINKQPFLRTADLVVQALLFGQIFARWGNFFNQEAYGLLITNPSWQWFPFAVFIERYGEYHCATFFYEIFLNIIGLHLLMLLYKKTENKPGVTLLAYFVWYGIVRSCLEFVRLDAVLRQWGDMTIRLTALYSSILAIVAAVLLVLVYKNKIKFKDTPFTTLDSIHSNSLEAEVEKSVKDFLDNN